MIKGIEQENNYMNSAKQAFELMPKRYTSHRFWNEFYKIWNPLQEPIDLDHYQYQEIREYIKERTEKVSKFKREKITIENEQEHPDEVGAATDVRYPYLSLFPEDDTKVIIENAIQILKQNGYRVLKPVTTEWNEI